MENVTWNSPVLLLEGFSLPPLLSLCVFVCLLLSFLFVVGANTLIVCAVIYNRHLHTPMYFLICNLAVIDVLANVNMLPRLLVDMLRPPPLRLITYAECVVQAFWGHLLATGVRTVLMVMAFDRYVAVCLPLHYASIMSPRMLAKLLVAAWTAALVLVSVLIGLTVRLNRCRLLIVGLFCSNAALFALSCESIYANNMYGLTFTAVLYVTSAGSMVLTYGSIITVSVRRDRALNPKALRTCLSHLLVYFLTLFSGLTLILFTRFPKLQQERLLASALYYALPGCLNPLIYGLQSHEIRKSVCALFQGEFRALALRRSDTRHFYLN